jgi:hypothetical protein
MGSKKRNTDRARGWSVIGGEGVCDDRVPLVGAWKKSHRAAGGIAGGEDVEVTPKITAPNNCLPFVLFSCRRIFFYSLFSFASFHLHVYMLFLSFTFASGIISYSLFSFAPFHLLLLRCTWYSGEGQMKVSNICHTKKYLPFILLFFLVVF